MFVRTERLTLRPAWAEDAPALAAAIDHESVIRNLLRAPWPYSLEAAETFVSSFTDLTQPKFLAFEHVGGQISLVGAAGIMPRGAEPHELIYWVTPGAWGRGLATEAAAAVIRAAASTGTRRITAGHFTDNIASGRVLRKLGFRPTGRMEPSFSQARNTTALTLRYELKLDEGDDISGVDPDARMAA